MNLEERARKTLSLVISVLPIKDITLGNRSVSLVFEPSDVSKLFMEQFKEFFFKAVDNKDDYIFWRSFDKTSGEYTPKVSIFCSFMETSNDIVMFKVKPEIKLNQKFKFKFLDIVDEFVDVFNNRMKLREVLFKPSRIDKTVMMAIGIYMYEFKFIKSSTMVDKLGSKLVKIRHNVYVLDETDESILDKINNRIVGSIQSEINENNILEYIRKEIQK